MPCAWGRRTQPSRADPRSIHNEVGGFAVGFQGALIAECVVLLKHVICGNRDDLRSMKEDEDITVSITHYARPGSISGDPRLVIERQPTIGHLV